jgi:hypothetical protein
MLKIGGLNYKTSVGKDLILPRLLVMIRKTPK